MLGRHLTNKASFSHSNNFLIIIFQMLIFKHSSRTEKSSWVKYLINIKDEGFGSTNLRNITFHNFINSITICFKLSSFQSLINDIIIICYISLVSKNEHSIKYNNSQFFQLLIIQIINFSKSISNCFNFFNFKLILNFWQKEFNYWLTFLFFKNLGKFLKKLFTYIKNLYAINFPCLFFIKTFMFIIYILQTFFNSRSFFMPFFKYLNN